MKRFLKIVALVGVMLGSVYTTDACTNFIVTRGASTDGSNMVTYAADSHQLYGALYQYIPGKLAEWMDVTEWDTGRYIGKIRQADVTYRTLGNSNEHSLFITETTLVDVPSWRIQRAVSTTVRLSISPCSVPRPLVRLSTSS